MMSEVVWLLPNTEFLQQVEDDVRDCSTTKYWIPSILEDDVRGVWLLLIMSQKALSNTEHLVRYGYYYNHKTMVIICSLKFYI